MQTQVSVTGDKELEAKLTNQLYAAPVRRMFTKIGFAVKGRAQDKAPRFDGALVNSIQTEVDRNDPPRHVRVGTNMEYAEAVEKGSRPHWAPIAALTPWAESKGIPPFAVQASIAVNGTAPHPFMGPALDESKSDVSRFLVECAADIERINTDLSGAAT